MSSRARALTAAPLTIAAVLAAFAVARPARADTWSDIGNQTPTNPEIDRRFYRSGLVVGFGLGYGLAGAEGYPNSTSRIGDPAYYSATNLLHGSGGTFFVMGALADYLNFGVWFGGATFQSSDWQSSGGGGGFRVEAFPLLVAVPALKDLGVFTQVGLGSATAQAKNGPYPAAHGVQSFIGAGAFYEWTVFHAIGGHAALGPSLEYDGIYSQTIARSSALAGLRFVFYGGQ